MRPTLPYSLIQGGPWVLQDAESMFNLAWEYIPVLKSEKQK
jgi:hypothetical protein